MEFDPASIVDRYSILKLKAAHGVDVKKETTVFVEEMSTLRKAYPSVPWPVIEDMYDKVNGLIWQEESKIRKGSYDHDMEGAGRAAIMNRNINSLRVGLGNILNAITGKGFQDKKVEHVAVLGGTG